MTGSDSSRDVISYDLGVVECGSKVTKNLLITNTSESEWTVRSAVSDCGCLVNNVEPSKIGPGGDSKLSFTYSTPNRSAEFSRNVLVTFNELGVKPIIILIKGYARNAFESNVEQIDFGLVTPGKCSSRRFEVVAYDSHKYAFAKIPDGFPGLSVRDVGYVESLDKYGNKAIATSIELIFSPLLDTRPGFYQQSVELFDNTKELSTSLVIRARVAASVEAIPDRLFFGFVSPHETASRSMLLHFGTAKTPPPEKIRIEQTPPDLLDVKLKQVDTAKQKLMLNIRFTPSAEGVFSGSLKIVIPDAPPLLIPYIADSRVEAK